MVNVQDEETWDLIDTLAQRLQARHSVLPGIVSEYGKRCVCHVRLVRPSGFRCPLAALQDSGTACLPLRVSTTKQTSCAGNAGKTLRSGNSSSSDSVSTVEVELEFPGIFVISRSDEIFLVVQCPGRGCWLCLSEIGRDRTRPGQIRGLYPYDRLGENEWTADGATKRKVGCRNGGLFDARDGRSVYLRR